MKGVGQFAAATPALAAHPAAAAGTGSYVLAATSTGGNYAPTFTGNGYLGVRVPPAGQGYAGGSVPAESTLAGFYAQAPGQVQQRANLPSWSTLTFSDGGQGFSLGTGQVTGWRQQLDLHTGVISTTATWTAPDGHVTDLRYEVFTDRARPDAAVVRLQLTPRWSGTATVTDLIDGTPATLTTGIASGFDAAAHRDWETIRTLGTGIIAGLASTVGAVERAHRRARRPRAGDRRQRQRVLPVGQHPRGRGREHPAGLSSNDYNGHIFWDAETWMYPSLLAQHPDLAAGINNYRFDRLAAAQAHAVATGYAGARFPWESALDGTEQIPPPASVNSEGIYEQHITADVALAQGVNPEFSGYQGEMVKQADATMLYYPWGYAVSPATAQHNLTYYVPRTDPGGPSMSDAINVVLHNLRWHGRVFTVAVGPRTTTVTAQSGGSPGGGRRQSGHRLAATADHRQPDRSAGPRSRAPVRHAGLGTGVPAAASQQRAPAARAGQDPAGQFLRSARLHRREQLDHGRTGPRRHDGHPRRADLPTGAGPLRPHPDHCGHVRQPAGTGGNHAAGCQPSAWSVSCGNAPIRGQESATSASWDVRRGAAGQSPGGGLWNPTGGPPGTQIVGFA